MVSGATCPFQPLAVDRREAQRHLRHSDEPDLVLAQLLGDDGPEPFRRTSSGCLSFRMEIAA